MEAASKPTAVQARTLSQAAIQSRNYRTSAGAVSTHAMSARRVAPTRAAARRPPRARRPRHIAELPARLIADAAEPDEAIRIRDEAFEISREAPDPFLMPQIDDRPLVEQDLHHPLVDFPA